MASKDALLKELQLIEAEIAKLENNSTNEESELEVLLEEELTILAEANLYHFLVASWQHIARGEFKENWYVDAICEHLMALRTRQIEKLAIAVSPRHAKSTICSVAFPVWCWIQDATHTFITASYGESLVVRDAVASRRLINTTWFQNRWGRLFKLRHDTNQKSRYENDKGGFRLATSIEGKGTGEGCRTLIIDDPHKALEAHSRVSKDKVSDWYFDTMSSRWETPETFTQLIVHQRLAEDDLIGRVLSQDSGWDYFALPIEYDPERTYTTSLGFEDPRREPGELLAPNLMSEETVAKEKRKGEWRWASQFQQQPVPKGGGYVKSEQINEYSDAGLPDHFDILVASWDLANSNKNDYCVGTVWGKVGSRRYLVDCIRAKLTFPQQIEAIVSFKLKYPEIRAILIEKKSNGQAAIDTLQRHVSGLIPMEPKDYGGDKESRFIACTPEFEAGNIYFPAPSNKGKSWVREFKNELLMFPKAKHDDAVDSTAYALLYLAKYGQTLKQYTTIEAEANRVESPIDLFDVRLINSSGTYYTSLFN
jgi:predicted phage terminase large subunit-like protein